MSQRCATAEQLDDVQPGVGFWQIKRHQCRWPLTELGSIYDFRFCGKNAYRCFLARPADDRKEIWEKFPANVNRPR